LNVFGGATDTLLFTWDELTGEIGTAGTTTTASDASTSTSTGSSVDGNSIFDSAVNSTEAVTKSCDGPVNATSTCHTFDFRVQMDERQVAEDPLRVYRGPTDTLDLMTSDFASFMSQCKKGGFDEDDEGV
jgi:hypothetical protein